MIGNVEVCFEVKRGWHSNGQGGVRDVLLERYV